jgi:FtsZ-binding cell division protein ZapB
MVLLSAKHNFIFSNQPIVQQIMDNLLQDIATNKLQLDKHSIEEIIESIKEVTKTLKYPILDKFHLFQCIELYVQEAIDTINELNKNIIEFKEMYINQNNYQELSSMPEHYQAFIRYSYDVIQYTECKKLIVVKYLETLIYLKYHVLIPKEQLCPTNYY